MLILNQRNPHREVAVEVDVEEVENDERVKDEVRRIPPIDFVLAQQIMSFLKELAGQGMIPPTQIPANPLVSSTVPKLVGEVGNNAFFHPLLDFVMTVNEHDMLTIFLSSSSRYLLV